MGLSPEDLAGLDDGIYRMAVEQSLDGVLITVPDGRILYANPAACAILGHPEEELQRLGRQGITDADDPRWHSAVVERRRRGHVRMVAPFIKGDGTSVMADISSAVFAGEDGTERSVVILRDVTQQLRLEQLLRASNEITRSLLAGDATTEVLTLIAFHARSLLGASEAAVLTAEGEPGSVVVTAAVGPGMTALLGRSYRGSWAAQVMLARRGVVVEDLTRVARQEDGRTLGLGPAVVVPIVADDQAFGTLIVATEPGSRAYAQSDLAIVESLAEAAAVAMALGRARAEVERGHRETAEQLRHALESRIVIEQAKGMVSAARGGSIDEAFERLRSYARGHSTKLHDVASAVVRRELLP